MPKIDHVVIAVRDLDRASDDLFDRYGLASVVGGRHEAWGTANRLVPIGDQYLELLVAEEPLSANPLAQAVHAASANGDTFLGVCCEVDDVDEVARRLGTNVVPGSRNLPDGREVSWRLTGLEGALTRGLPFFIQWGAGREFRMGDEQAIHAIAPVAITGVDVGGDQATLDQWLNGGIPEVRRVGGSPGVRDVVASSSTVDLLLEF
jgi:catechol 2,3-dioxygenase-like lactoylglutathione lyase family enzyme